jgi:hypothetical protein
MQTDAMIRLTLQFSLAVLLTAITVLLSSVTAQTSLIQPGSNRPLLPVAVGLESVSGPCRQTESFFAYELMAGNRVYLRLTLVPSAEESGGGDVINQSNGSRVPITLREEAKPDEKMREALRVVLRSGAERQVLPEHLRDPSGKGCLIVTVAVPALAR